MRTETHPAAFPSPAKTNYVAEPMSEDTETANGSFGSAGLEAVASVKKLHGTISSKRYVSGLLIACGLVIN